MNVSAISAEAKTNAANGLNCKPARRMSFQGDKAKGDDIFEKAKASRQVPEGKAIQYKKRPGISLLDVLLLPFGIFGFNVKTKPELVDFDPENITPKQEKLIKSGKLTNTVPPGYQIKNDKLVKVK